MRHTVELLLVEGAPSEGLPEALTDAGFEVAGIRVLPSSPGAWKEALEAFSRGGAACLLTVGCAMPPGDFLPDLTASLIARPVPGIPEAIRALPEASPVEAALFRGTAGITEQGRILVNLPAAGAWRASAVGLLALILAHALDKAAGDQADCGLPSGAP